MTREKLTEIWRAVHNQAGWLSVLSGVMEKSDVDFLTKLDDDYHEAMGGLKTAWRLSLPKLQRPEAGLAEERSHRRAYLDSQLAAARGHLMAVRLERGRLVQAGRDEAAAVIRVFEADAAQEIEKLRRNLERLEAASEAFTEDRISDDAIRRAREVRLGTLLGVDEKKKFPCPFHGADRKPSASISKGFFKCFTCGKGPVDAIGWLMEVEGYNFPAAIERLVRL